MTKQLLLLLLAIGQLALPPLLFAQGFDQGAARPPLAAAANPATPAGYAFIIWGFIYLGSLALAVYALTAAGRADPLIDRIIWPCIAGFGLCLLWLVAASKGPVWLTVPIIIGMGLALGSALFTILTWPQPLGWVRQVAVAAPLGLYFGWLTAAMFVNAADVLPGYGFNRFGLAPGMFGLLVIAAAGALAIAFVALAGPHPAYVAAVLWALSGIIVRNGTPSLENMVALAAGIAIVALLIAVFWFANARRSDAMLPL